MTAKKRVYDLAKEFGMTGQELASKLRDIGFSQVKSHMTALSEQDEMEVRGRLEAYGLVGMGTEEAVETVGGLKIKRRKKKLGIYRGLKSGVIREALLIGLNVLKRRKV